MAGTATITYTKGSAKGGYSIDKYSVAFVGDHVTGAFPVATITGPEGSITGYLKRVSRIPGVTPPTAGNTVIVADGDGVDLGAGLMVGNGAAAVADYYNANAAINGSITITPSGSTAIDANLVVTIYIETGNALMSA